MLRKKKDNSDYEIDRELTGKFAIEKNAEYQDRIAELEKKNEKLRKKCNRLEKEYRALQVEHSRLLFDMDAVIDHEVDKKSKKLREKNKEIDKAMDMIEDMGELINLFRLLIYDTKDMTDSERVEKIGNAINILYNKYDVY